MPFETGSLSNAVNADQLLDDSLTSSKAYFFFFIIQKSIKFISANFNGPVKCDVTATSGIRGWLKTKQTVSLYKTERDIFVYISAKIKKKMSIYFAADCNHRCLRERCRIFSLSNGRERV